MNGVAGVVIDELVVIERQVWLKLRLVEVHIVVCIVVKKYGGQPIHLTVMLSEQLFEFLLICHTPIIHTKTDLLNP